MRKNRTCGSEGGSRVTVLPYPYQWGPFAMKFQVSGTPRSAGPIREENFGFASQCLSLPLVTEP